jgi:hypothetical protein
VTWVTLGAGYVLLAVVVATLVRIISKFVAGPKVSWRSGLYWGAIVMLATLVGGTLLNLARLPQSLRVPLAALVAVGLHVGIGGAFMVTRVRAVDGSRLPWAWGAKVTGFAGLALLFIGVILAIVGGLLLGLAHW